MGQGAWGEGVYGTERVLNGIRFLDALLEDIFFPD